MRKFLIPIVLLLSLSVISGCGSAKYAAESRYMETEVRYMKEKEEGTASLDIQQPRIIYSASLNMVVPQPDSANIQIANIAEKYEGYINSIGTHMTVIRVKKQYFEQAMEEVILLGKLQDKNLSGQDVTQEYYDFEIRLENARKARSRYLELLAKAEDVKAALLVEKELERLNGEIEFLEGRMNNIDHLSEFSTITIYLKEKKKLGLFGYIGKGLYEGVKWLFVRN